MEAERVSNEEEKRKDIRQLYEIYETLSENSKIMMMTYSTALRDKEMVDQQHNVNADVGGE